MRILTCLLALLFLGFLVLVRAENMPAVVAKFEETKDLWHTLYRGNYVTGTFSTPLNGPSPIWQDFLRTHGTNILEEE